MREGLTLACYLLREDGEWYDLGNKPEWRLSFAVFPGPADGSVMFGPEDVALLSMRLDGDARVAADIVRWGCGKWMRFVSEFEPEVEPDVLPAPITGYARLVG